MVVEPMSIEILNDDLVGFDNTTSRDMIDHLFLSYGSITAVDIEQNFENMRKAWDPQQPVEPSLSRSKIVLTSQKPVELQLVQRRSYHLLTPRYSNQENLTVLVADGMTKLKQTRPGTISRSILLLHIVSTDKCKGKL
jgi:hypothetical protein